MCIEMLTWKKYAVNMHKIKKMVDKWVKMDLCGDFPQSILNKIMMINKLWEINNSEDQISIINRLIKWLNKTDNNNSETNKDKFKNQTLNLIN